jgi:hypothetical protein
MLTRQEDDQLFLDESASGLETEQRQLIAKVNKINPLAKAVGATSGLMILVIAGWAVYIGLHSRKTQCLSEGQSSGCVTRRASTRRSSAVLSPRTPITIHWSPSCSMTSPATNWGNLEPVNYLFASVRVVGGEIYAFSSGTVPPDSPPAAIISQVIGVPCKKDYHRSDTRHSMAAFGLVPKMQARQVFKIGQLSAIGCRCRATEPSLRTGLFGPLSQTSRDRVSARTRGRCSA